MAKAVRKTKPGSKRNTGRPTKYTVALANELCRRLAEGESLRAICTDERQPSVKTIMNWLFDGEHKEFEQEYARARRVQAEMFAEEIIDIADDTFGDTTTGKDGDSVTGRENIQRSRLRVDARKWIASKLLPKVYGDKIQHTGEDGGPIVLGLEPILTKALKTAREHERRLGSEEDQD